MRPEVPLELLGLVGPILAWVEGAQAQAIPKSWAGEPSQYPAQNLLEIQETNWAAASQERGWLLHELPTHSLDNIDEVTTFARGYSSSVQGRDHGPTSRTRVAPPKGYDLWHVLETLSIRYLTWNGGKVAIRAGRMVELHELGLRLPLGLIVRHVHARAVAAQEQNLADVAELPEAVSLLPSDSHGLRSVIRRGLSEGHLHLNSVHATEVAWADHLLHTSRPRSKSFEVVEWRLLRLARAAVRQLALATAVVRSVDTSGLDDDPASDRAKRFKRLLELYDCMYFAATEARMTFFERRWQRTFQEAVGEILTPRVLEVADQWTYSRKGSHRIQPNNGRLGLLHWLDPHRLTRNWLLQGVQTSYHALTTPVEREECLAALHLAAHLALIETPQRRRTDDASELDDATEVGTIPRWRYTGLEGHFLHQSLFRYFVCKTHHWQLGVQQGRTTGLRHFRKYYGSNQRWPLASTDRDRADAVLRRVRSWRGLRVLEGRVGPPRGERDLLPWLAAFASKGRERRVEKMGLVVHFIKYPESDKPKNANFRARFAEQRSQYRSQAFDLFRILERPSLVTPFIVGIDAANLELATPPEIFAPVFRFLRDRPIALLDSEELDLEAREVQESIRQMIETRRLGMTYHVGEEFRHLLSGLRAIDEVIEFLAPRSGDRIGHGIALGLDPEVWLEHVGRQTLVSKQEWLDTMVWLHQLLGAGHNDLGILKVEETIERLGREIYLKPDTDSFQSVTPLILRDVWRLRQLDPEMYELDTQGGIVFQPLAGEDSATWRWNRTMRRMLQDIRRRVGPNISTVLLSRYWYSETCRARGQELMLVDMEEELDAWLRVCCEAQRRMQQRISKKQIAVEVNPSVNRVIGPMSRYADHHIFKMTLDDDKQWKRWLRVTVNTDNPATANTCLTHEFYLLGEALMSSGVPEVEAAEWLEWLRQAGKDSTFVRQLPPPRSEAMVEITEKLRNIRRPLRELRSPEETVRELWQRWTGLPNNAEQ